MPEGDRDEHYWSHATCFNGREVQSEALMAVYEVMGQEMDWVAPREDWSCPMMRGI